MVGWNGIGEGIGDGVGGYKVPCGDGEKVRARDGSGAASNKMKAYEGLSLTLHVREYAMFRAFVAM